MTVSSTEVKQENILPQEKVDTKTPQQNAEKISSQQNITPDNKNQEDAQEDPNWRAFREARKKDRSEREAAERRAAEKEAEATALKAAMEAAFAKSPSSQRNTEYYGQVSDQQEESEDERIEKKVQAAILAREAASEKARIQREQQEYPQRLTQAYPDFNQTISQDNLDYLDYHYPEVSRSLQRLQDGFDKWSDIYQVIKKFVPNSTTAKKESMRADMNQNKPKSISSTGLTQTGNAPGSHILSEDRKASNWERMQRTLKGLS